MSGVRAGVIGHPVGHSKSPLIHAYWLRKYNISGTYDAIDIPPEKLETGLRELVQKGYSGFNLTLPHKELVLPLCTEIDETARAVGAVNTLVVKNGRYVGTNTDVFGFTENIKQNAPGFKFAAGPAVVLGAGGAARGVVCGLLREGAPEIRILNRTRAKAEAVAAMSPKVKVFDWGQTARAFAAANLLVNTTSLGMKGQPPLRIDLLGLPSVALVNDIVYAPLQTELLEKARARGNPVVTGIGMLLHQARPAFRAWYGVMPDIDSELLKKVSQ